MLASGVMGVSGASLKYVSENGAGAVVSKSIGPEERKGHPNPVLAEFKGGFLNAVGLPNAGVENSLGELEFAQKNASCPVIVSVFGGSKDEFVDVAVKANSIGPPMIELDLSCPNTEVDFGKPFATSCDDAAYIIREIKQRISTPIMAKLAPNVPNLAEIAKACEDAGADAISAVNTMPGMLIDIETKKPVLYNKSGGVSGPALHPIAVKCVYDISRTVKIPVVGIGGVTTGKDALQMMMAGATAVQIGTAIYYRGIDVFRQVCEEMETYLKENNYSSINEIIGAAH